MLARPDIEPTAPLQFVINAAAGSSDADEKRQVIEAALQAGGRQGKLLFSEPANLAGVAQQAATLAIATGTAVRPTCCAATRPHFQPRGSCQIEQWDFSAAECAFVRATVSAVWRDRS